MNREFDDPDEPLEDWEVPEPDEEEDPNGTETVECPGCGAEIYEHAEQCPHCGEYVIQSAMPLAGPLAGRPLWFILLGLAGIAAVIYAFMWYQ